jgi:hypothetical protein
MARSTACCRLIHSWRESVKICRESSLQLGSKYRPASCTKACPQRARFIDSGILVRDLDMCAMPPPLPLAPGQHLHHQGCGRLWFSQTNASSGEQPSTTRSMRIE